MYAMLFMYKTRSAYQFCTSTVGGVQTDGELIREKCKQSLEFVAYAI